MSPTWEQLQAEITGCTACPRLREHCRQVGAHRRRSYAQQTYWTGPVPTFGSASARLLLVGLAPGAHGANRTGRMFTGDRSGEFLYAGLHRADFATSAESHDRNDGLQLRDCAITAAAHCAPPNNRPLPEEFERCRGYLRRELGLLSGLRVILTLGKLAHDQVLAVLLEEGWITTRARYRFAHGAEYKVGAGVVVLSCYHPSQQNTFTGRMTAAMLDAVLARARGALAD